MSKFISKSAGESSDNESSDDNIKNRNNNKKQKIRKSEKMIDSSEEEDEDEEMTKEDLDFIKTGKSDDEEDSNNSDSEQENEDSEVSPDELSDEDLDLIEENLGKRRNRINGPSGAAVKKDKFKRLRRRNEIGSSDEEEESNDKGGSVSDAEGGLKKQKRDLKDLFNDDDEDEEDKAKGERGGYSSDSSTSDLDDFIEEDEDELPATIGDALRMKKEKMASKAAAASGVPRRRAIVDDREAAPQRALSSALASGQISRQAWDEMMEIFGDGTDYLDMVIESDEEEEIIKEKRREKELAAEAGDDNNRDSNNNNNNQKRDYFTKDFPERLLALGVDSDSISEEALQKESLHIARKIQKLCPTDSISGLASAILSVLRFIHQHGFEVPFIATYRREYFSNFFKMNEIWVILDEDVRYRQAMQLKRKIQEKLNFADEINQTSSSNNNSNNNNNNNNNNNINSSMKEYLLEALESEWDEAQLQLILEYVIKKKSNNNSSSVLLDFACKLIPGPERFIENVKRGRVVHGPLILTEREMENEAVEVIARDAAGSLDSAISGAAGVLAEEFGTHPLLFAVVRDLLIGRADVTVTPTALGAIEISHDPSHYLMPLQYVREKTVSTFIGEQGLALTRGLEAKLIEIEHGYGGYPSEVLDEHMKAFLPSGIQDFRDRVFAAAWRVHWLPRLNRLVLQRLKQESEIWTATFCQFRLQTMMMSAPLTGLTDMGSSGLVASVTLKQGTLYLVDLDRQGRVIRQEVLRNSHISKALSEKTRVVVISGEGQECLELYQDLKGLRSRDYSVLWGCDDVAQIYKSSMRAAREFPECEEELKYALCVGRRMLDPVQEFAQLSDDELLKISLHPLQGHLPRALRLKHLHRTLINVINLLGVSINELRLSGAKQAMLTYVSGLGPHKAGQLVKALGNRWLNSRAELVTELGLGRRTFTNCAGFIKITPETKLSSGKKGPSASAAIKLLEEPLDGTRIHPESYELARKMAADALEIDDPSVTQRRNEIFGDEGEDREAEVIERSKEVLAGAIVQIMTDPRRLDDLLLEEYAREIERIKKLPKHETLKDIIAELHGPFPDPRANNSGSSEDFSAPNSQVIRMLTGREETWWYLGRQVTVKLLSPTSRKLANLVDAKGLVVGVEGDSVSRSVRPGVPLTAFITRLDLDRLIVDVSLRKPDNQAELMTKFVEFDGFYDFQRATKNKVADGVKEGRDSHSSQSSQYPSSSNTASSASLRQLNHPAFKAFNRAEAEKYLLLAPVGEFVLRPSSLKRPSGDLTLSWKVGPGLFSHVPIDESDRPVGQDWLLGRTLLLPSILNPGKFDGFEDLDEIVARRLEPVVSLLHEAQGCPKYFSDSSRDAISAHLRQQAASNPGRTPYCIVLAKEPNGGHLLLCHPRRQELIRVDPRGFALTDPRTNEMQIFERIDKLVDYFKRNYKNFASTESGSGPANEAANSNSKTASSDPRAASKYQQFAN